MLASLAIRGSPLVVDLEDHSGGFASFDAPEKGPPRTLARYACSWKIALSASAFHYCDVSEIYLATFLRPDASFNTNAILIAKRRRHEDLYRSSHNPTFPSSHVLAMLPIFRSTRVKSPPAPLPSWRALISPSMCLAKSCAAGAMQDRIRQPV